MLQKPNRIVFIHSSKRGKLRVRKYMTVNFTHYMIGNLIQLSNTYLNLDEANILVICGGKSSFADRNSYSILKKRYPEKKFLVLSRGMLFNIELFIQLGQNDRVLFNIYLRKKSLRKVELILGTLSQIL